MEIQDDHLKELKMYNDSVANALIGSSRDVSFLTVRSSLITIHTIGSTKLSLKPTYIP